MAMNALRKGASGGITKFILMGFMALAVGGLVLTDVGGFFRGGITTNDVARVGDETVSIVDFDRVLRNNLAQIGLSAPDAYRLGYINQVLSAEIRTRLLSQAASDLGVEVGSQQVAAHVRTLVAPLVQPGQSARDVVEQTLAVRGLNEADFFDSVARDLESSMLQDAISAPLTSLPDALVLDLYRYEKETRNIEYIPFLYEDVSLDTQPTQDDLVALYEATKEAYAIPERRNISVLEIKTDDLAKTIEISEDELRSYYERNIDMFSQPESWSLEQTIVDDQGKAQEIYGQVKAGKSLEAATEEVLGNKNAFLGKQSATQDQMLEVIHQSFEDRSNESGVLSPVKSPLGWHVVVLNGYTDARVKSFDSVKDQIRSDMIDERLIDQKYELADQADDLFASGAAAADIAAAIPVTITQVNTLTATGRTHEGETPLADFPEDARPSIVQEAFNLTIEGEASPIFEIQDGTMMAVVLEGVIPRSYPAFEEVQDSLKEQWVRDEKFTIAQQKATEAFGLLLSQSASLKEVSDSYGQPIKSLKDIGRTASNSDRFGRPAISQIFDTAPDGFTQVEINGGVALVKVTDFMWPSVDTQSQDYLEFRSNLEGSLENEILAAYINRKSQQYGTLVNQRLLDQVYGSQGQ